MFRGAGFWRAAWHLVRVFLGRHLREPDITHTRARAIEIRAKHLPMHVDGEPIGETPAQIRLIPRALRVLVPPQANAALFT
jgi:diacylglycerol kinase family enzyme